MGGWSLQDPLRLLFQHCQGLQRHDQDQWSGQRVLANCQQGAHTLVHGSRQVSAHEARGVHAKGVLQVDKLSKKKGNYVYVNGRTVGLSNKLNDFEGLAVRMAAYEKTLAILTAKLAGKYKKTNKAHVAYVKPPAWRGD